MNRDKRIYIILLTIVFVNLSLILTANASPDITWQKCLGGTKGEQAKSVQQTSDGGYIVAGSTSSNDGDVNGNHGPGSDIWVVRLDKKSGAMQWQKCLGGTSNDQASSVQQTSDGGYIVTGTTSSTDGDVKGYHSKSGGLMIGTSVVKIDLGGGDIWVVKLDKSGAMQWQKCLGGTSKDKAGSVRQTSDGGYIVAGSTDSTDGDVNGNHGSGSDIWVVKLDKSGAMQWQKCLGGTSNDQASSVQQTSDGGYIVAGSTDSTDGDVNGNHASGSDIWVVKLDKSGAMQWQKCLGGSNLDQAKSVQQTSDGGYIVAGLTYSGDGSGDVKGNHGTIIGSEFLPYLGVDAWVVKLDKSGAMQWQMCLGGTSDDQASSVQQTSDGGYIVAGSTSSNNGNVSGWHGSSFEHVDPTRNYWVVKLSPIDGIE